MIEVKDMAAYLATILIDKGFMKFSQTKLSTLQRILAAVKRTSTKLQMRSFLATQYDLTSSQRMYLPEAKIDWI